MWRRRVEAEILAKWPEVIVVMARAYDRPHTLTKEGADIPGVKRPEEGTDPLRALSRHLKEYYDPPMAVLFHPLGGFSVINL